MTPSQTEIDRLIEAVRETARAEVLPSFRRLEEGQVSTKTNRHDLVTVVDRAVEERLSATARSLWGTALVVGEEATAARPALLDGLDEAELAVIIDPVDGTGNYVAGLSTFGMIIALCARGETFWGLLYDPLLDDWVMAEKGGGAYFVQANRTNRRLNGGALRARSECRGYLPLHLFPDTERPGYAALFARFGRVNSLGCSCHEYRQLALGEADFCFSPNPKPWDHAAGVLIARESTGASVMSDGRTYRPSVTRGNLLALANARSVLTPDDFLIA